MPTVRFRSSALRALPFAVAFVLALGFAAGRQALAQEAKGTPKEKVTLTGKIVCAGCHLEKSHGAEPQCTLHSRHAQGFLAEDGTLYTILDNARGHLVITNRKLDGKPIKIEAYRFPKAQVLEVLRYELKEGESWVKFDFCKNCGFEKGDNAGKDVCDDCASE